MTSVLPGLAFRAVSPGAQNLHLNVDAFRLTRYAKHAIVNAKNAKVGVHSSVDRLVKNQAIKNLKRILSG
jgi:hypothetical protein